MEEREREGVMGGRKRGREVGEKGENKDGGNGIAAPASFL